MIIQYTFAYNRITFWVKSEANIMRFHKIKNAGVYLETEFAHCFEHFGEIQVPPLATEKEVFELIEQKHAADFEAIERFASKLI
jgi:hypothetical protein